MIAGKAHPADEAGQALIQEWIHFIRQPEVRPHVIFLSDYDMLLTEHLVQGVDVWINTPRRPWEACGTSGMKVLVNGGLNISELDGWWAEAYAPELGWALGKGDGPPNDERDAADLFALLEREVIPEFYDRDTQGTPRRWLARVRASMAKLTPAFSSNRMALEYVEKLYADAGERFRRRAARAGEIAKSLVVWEASLAAHWSDVHITTTKALVHGPTIEFIVEVGLGSVAPGDVRVEIYADPVGHEQSLRQPMQEVTDARSTPGRRLFSATVTTTRSVDDFTPRVVPFHPEALVPNEVSFIAWSR
jgi:starch phosphorylase